MSNIFQNISDEFVFNVILFLFICVLFNIKLYVNQWKNVDDVFILLMLPSQYQVKGYDWGQRVFHNNVLLKYSVFTDF